MVHVFGFRADGFGFFGADGAVAGEVRLHECEVVADAGVDAAPDVVDEVDAGGDAPARIDGVAPFGRFLGVALAEVAVDVEMGGGAEVFEPEWGGEAEAEIDARVAVAVVEAVLLDVEIGVLVA